MAASTRNPHRKPKANPAKHKYVQSKILGMTDRQAAMAAGHNESSAVHLSKDPWVIRELASHEESMREERKFTLLKAEEMYLEAFQMSRVLEQPGDMIRATSELTKLHGLNAVEKKEITLTGDLEVRHNEYKQLSDAELLQMANQERPAIDAEFEELTND